MTAVGNAALAIGVVTAVAAPARAQVPSAAEETAGLRRGLAAEAAASSPGIVAADTGTALGAGMAWGGYDGATRTPLVGASAEVRIGSRLVIGAGATYAARDAGEPAAVRPSALARVQLLDQQRHGIDLAVAAGYRQDRFVSEDGLIQGTVALGVHGAAGAVLVNLGYGQDGEGDDHLADARVVALHPLMGGLHVGLDGHVQWLLDSSDPNRGAHDTPSLALTVAPAMTYGAGPVTLSVEVGWSGVDRDAFQSGVVALGGVGTAF